MKELINKAFKIYNDYKMPILYIFFGGLTTLVNIATYSLCYYFYHIDNVPSNIIAWVLAVIFAFITNKIYVFESKSKSISNSQILFSDYDYDKALLVLQEMALNGCQRLLREHLIASHVGIMVGYSKDVIPANGGTIKMANATNLYSHIK